jgi:hypothetical protein
MRKLKVLVRNPLTPVVGQSLYWRGASIVVGSDDVQEGGSKTAEDFLDTQDDSENSFGSPRQLVQSTARVNEQARLAMKARLRRIFRRVIRWELLSVASVYVQDVVHSKTAQRTAGAFINVDSKRGGHNHTHLVAFFL